MKRVFEKIVAARSWKPIFLNCLMIAALAGGLSAQQAPPAVEGPIPAQIATARKVFISNMGVDGSSFLAFRATGDVNRPYAEFYAAMKKWGHYELVSSPSDADLVFELRFEAPLVAANTMDISDPHFELKIVDAKTHFVLWTVLEPVGGAFRKTTWLKNFDTGLGNLMIDLEDLNKKPH